MSKPKKVYVIRVAKLPEVWNIPAPIPWNLGDYMRVYYNEYAGSTLESVGHLSDATFFGTKEAAQEMIDECKHHVCTYEIVTFREEV